MQTAKLGSRWRFTETFTDLVANAVTDPTTVVLKLKDPSGVETSYTYAAAQIARDSVGVYHFDVTFSMVGQWTARWVAGGALIAADEFFFRVEASAFAAP